MPAQLSLFSVGVRPPAYADLEGLLAGPAQVTRRGPAARLSLLLLHPDSWRIAALQAGLTELGLCGEVTSAPGGPGEQGGAVGFRTEFAAELSPLALRWTRGATTAAPPDLVLDGPRLRWWCLAAGHSGSVGYVLHLGTDESSWSRVGGALAAAGVPGTFIRARGAAGNGRRDGEPAQREPPAYRIVGARRLRRLAELVGPAPADAPPGAWPEAGSPD